MSADIPAEALWLDQAERDCRESLRKHRGRRYAAHRRECYRLASLYAMLAWVTRLGWCVPLHDEPYEAIKGRDWRRGRGAA